MKTLRMPNTLMRVLCVFLCCGLLCPYCCSSLTITTTCSPSVSRQSLSLTQSPSRDASRSGVSVTSTRSITPSHTSSEGFSASATASISEWNTASFSHTPSSSEAASSSTSSSIATVTGSPTRDDSQSDSLTRSPTSTTSLSNSSYPNSTSVSFTLSCNTATTNVTVSVDQTASVSAPGKSPTPTISPSGAMPSNSASNTKSYLEIPEFEMSLASSIATVGSAVVFFGASAVLGQSAAGGPCGTIHIMLLQVSSCRSSERDPTIAELFAAREKTGGVTKFVVSPFWNSGLLIAAYGNVAFLVLGAWMYSGVVLILSERARRAQYARAVALSYGQETLDDVENAEHQERQKLKGIRRAWHPLTIEYAAWLKFPGFAVRLAEVLVPGSVYCAVGFLLVGDETDENSSGYSSALAIIAALVYILSIAVFIRFRLRPCVSCTEFPKASDHDAARRRLFCYKADALDRWVPTHGWEPADLRRAFGELFDGMQPRFVYHRVVETAVACWIGGLCAFASFGFGLSCTISCAVMALSLLMWAILIAYHKYHRLPLDRVLIPVLLIIFVAMLGLKALGNDTPEGGVVVVFVGIVCRVVYGFWIEWEETRLRAVAAHLAAAAHDGDEVVMVELNGDCKNRKGDNISRLLEHDTESLDEMRADLLSAASMDGGSTSTRQPPPLLFAEGTAIVGVIAQGSRTIDAL